MAAQTTLHRDGRAVRRAVLLDAGIAIVVLALTLTTSQSGSHRELDGLAVVLAGLASLPLAARRRAPLAVFAATAAANAALVALGYVDQTPGPVVALYFLATAEEKERGRPWLMEAIIAALFVLQVVAWSIVHVKGYSEVPPPLTGLVWIAAWVVGERARDRRERRAELERRATTAKREAERERRLAAAEERGRIARDLHDSAGHALNVILVQAGAARLLQERDPQRTRAALETIEAVARETAGEIDQLVRVLREDRPADEGHDGVEPPPGLASLEALAERRRASGLSVTTEAHGTSRPLSPAVDRAAYRILQEALTNAARHGGGSAAVAIRFGPQVLELTVTNPLSGSSSAAGGGHGIVGMRERAGLLGGSLDAGPVDGSFTVRARLPYGRASDER